MTRVGALWIGGLEPYMDESFLNSAMMNLGQDGIVSIKVMSNKFTGEPAGYGFINFESDQKAIFVMHRLGGKVIPNSNPPVRFKLNHNSTRLQTGETDTSVWVGDLTPEVDDFMLYQYFTQRYQTVRCAKVVLDEAGFSKGYGFVRFGSEAEQQHALSHMTGEMGLGSKPIKVSMANQKSRAGSDIMGGGPPSGGRDNGWGAMEVGRSAGGSGGQDSGWPGSTPSGAATAGWPNATSNSNTNGTAPGAGSAGALAAAAASGHPDYNIYHQYYQQYTQHLNQQQQYAAAWNAWQQQQQQQQQ